MTLTFRNRIPNSRQKMKTFVGCVNVHSEIYEGVVHLVFGHMGHIMAIALRDWDVEIEQGANG